MLQMLRRLLHEMGTGRALVNASEERAQEVLMLLRVEALARRMENPVALEAERPVAAA
jgi:hypothetical protein